VCVSVDQVTSSASKIKCFWSKSCCLPQTGAASAYRLVVHCTAVLTKWHISEILKLIIRLPVSRCTAKLRKTTASAPAWNNSPPTGWIFMKFDIVNIFWKSVEKIQVSLKSEEQWALYLCTFIIISHSGLLRMRNILDKLVEQIKAHVLCSITFFFNSCHLWDNVENYCRARQATDDNMMHAHCMLDN
jgi:hypothetical protein